MPEYTWQEINTYYDKEDWLQKAIQEKPSQVPLQLAASFQIFVSSLDKIIGTINVPPENLIKIYLN